MRMQMTSQIDAGGNDPIFLMFHGYGNDESEMVRILDAVYAPTRADAAPAAIAAVPSYISFRATYARPYMGGNYWASRRLRRGRAPTRMRGGRGCGGFTAGRLGIRPSQEDIDRFLPRRLSVVSSGQGTSDVVRCRRSCSVLRSWARNRAAFDSPTRFFLAYGAQDRTIPLPDQQTAHQVLERAGHLTYREYSAWPMPSVMEEIADIRDFLRAI